MCKPAAPYLLTPDGRVKVKSASQFETGGHYLVVPSGCRYEKSDVPTALLELLRDKQKKPNCMYFIKKETF